MLILRIRQAECALADERLDEAFELVSADSLRQHRRGQDLAGRLARALVSRGQEHLAAGRLPQAESDCHKAIRLAGNLPEAARLREAISTAVLARRQAEQRQTQVVTAARQQIQQGHLTLGENLLGELGNAPHAAALLQDVAARRSALETVISKAGDALRREDWEAAVLELAKVRPMDLADTRLRELMSQATAKAAARITAAIDAGRLDLADLLLKRLQPIAEHSVDVEQLRRALDQCRLVWQCIERGGLREAEQVLRRVATLLPSANWVESAMASLQRAGQSLEELRSGPLAMLCVAGPGAGVRDADPRAGRPAMVPQAMAAAAGRQADRMPAAPGAGMTQADNNQADGVPARLLLQVDGVGSFLVMRGRQVTIGPVSASHVPDVAVLADAATPAVTIDRTDEDYFLRSHLPVGVNERLTCGKLLNSGDRIALSSRCRFAFILPSAASTTAVLDLTSARLPRTDVRRVILLDRELILGPASSAHIRCDQLAEPAAILIRDGALYCQTSAPLSVDERPASSDTPIALGAHVRAGEMSFVVTRV